MKKIVLFLFLLVGSISVNAEQLILIHLQDNNHIGQLMMNNDLRLHFLSREFAIATTNSTIRDKHELLAANPWNNFQSYYVVYAEPEFVSQYTFNISSIASVLYKADGYLIVSINETLYGQLPPARNDGLVRIHNKSIGSPKPLNYAGPNRTEPDPFIESLLNEVNDANITSSVQHLEDFGTRNAYTTQSVEAQNWIADQFESFDLEVEIMNFSMPGGNASDNVIATLTGSVYPDEYVIVGAHYDSYSNSGAAPGADDNASGTAAVIEIARIMSQYTFDRTLVFCAFSGEEYGLYGSDAYASRCADQGMDIHGYFNLDMIGYLQNGSYMHTDLIYPPSAEELANFYTDICATYLPGFAIEQGMLQGGDSDHTSFNNNGFMGIFPFEDSQNYSPYIHTSNDLVGPSYNNAQQARVFTQASLASAASLANRINPPRNLAALPFDNRVKLIWDEMADIDHFNIYRDDVLTGTSEQTSYNDLDVENGTAYNYHITAIYSESGEESDKSNTVTVVPMPLLALPYYDDFEEETNYWEISSNWGLTSSSSHSPAHSFTDSPGGAYQNNVVSYASLRPFSLVGDIEDVSLSFWAKFDLETGYDYVWLEISPDGNPWTSLASYNGTQNSWQKLTYSLNDYIGSELMRLRFRFESDTWVTADGFYLDDVEINQVITNLKEIANPVGFYPNPATDFVHIMAADQKPVSLKIFDQSGRELVNHEQHGEFSIDIRGLSPGMYIMKLVWNDGQATAKLIIR
ncbi:MAG: M28 family peptidase [Bacteroidales bacterium]|nr:M28 family peptidase [Bacteroidales bacterium]